MKYLKVWTSFREVLTPLTESEKGRLFEAMLIYAECGEEPNFKGNERFIWAVAKQSIDRMAQHNEQMKQNGSKGGRPKKEEKPVIIPFASDEELIRQQQENDAVFEEMDRAGFKLNMNMMDKVSDFIATYGKEAVLRAVNECNDHSANNLAYMRKVLEGGKKPQKKPDDDDGLNKYEGWA